MSESAVPLVLSRITIATTLDIVSKVHFMKDYSLWKMEYRLGYFGVPYMTWYDVVLFAEEKLYSGTKGIFFKSKSRHLVADFVGALSF